MTRRKQHYNRTPHRELAMTHSILALQFETEYMLAAAVVFVVVLLTAGLYGVIWRLPPRPEQLGSGTWHSSCGPELDSIMKLP